MRIVHDRAGGDREVINHKRHIRTVCGCQRGTPFRLASNAANAQRPAQLLKCKAAFVVRVVALDQLQEVHIVGTVIGVGMVRSPYAS